MQSGDEAVMRMQRLAADGTPLLDAGGVVVSETGDAAPMGNLLVPTEDGDVILGYVPTYSFMANRQIKAQRFDASGSAVWEESVWVMDDATLPMGHYFDLKPDGENGALFCWDVAVGNSFDARLQRITPDGTEMLSHNGVYPEAGGPAGQISPSALWDAGNDTYTMAYIDMNSAQSARGLYAQHFDSEGNRLWAESGKVLLPQDTDMELSPALALVDGMVMGVVEQGPGWSLQRGHHPCLWLGRKRRFPLGGHHRLCHDPQQQGRFAAVFNGETVVAVWEDDRAGSPDIYVQNLNDDGTLGPYDVSVDPEQGPATLPGAFALVSSYPNPFNPCTTIAFELSRAQEVNLRIFDLKAAWCANWCMAPWPPSITPSSGMAAISLGSRSPAAPISIIWRRMRAR